MLTDYLDSHNPNPLIKSMKKTVLFILLVLLVSPAMGQDATSLVVQGKADMYKAFNQNDLDAIKKAQALFQRASQDEDVAPHAYYYMALAEYRLASLNEDKMVKHINNGIDYLEKMLKMDKENVEGSALLGSMVGWKAGLKPMQAMFLGPRSTRLLAAAEEADPTNPRVVLYKAISDFNTPKQFGGDKDRAIAGFQEAARLFEERTPKDELEPTWGHPDTYAWLGIAHVERDQKTEARAAFEKALEIDPEFSWVKHGLMPQLDEGE